MTLKEKIIKKFIATKSWWESGVKILAIIMNPIATFTTVYTAILVTTNDIILSGIISIIFVLFYLGFCVFIGYIWQEKGLNLKQSAWDYTNHRNNLPNMIANEVIKRLKEEKKIKGEN